MSDSKYTPNEEPWMEIDKMVQVRIAVYDAEGDQWLMSRRGITSHGGAPNVEQSLAELENVVTLEVHGALRAIQAAWKREKHG